MSTLNSTQLRSAITYAPSTGTFARKNPRDVRPCGTINAQGYVQIYIDGRVYYGHRLAWLYVYGTWPRDCLDHIDGDRSNNAISNLREVTRRQNRQNMHRPKGSNPYLGVSFHPASRLWHARIQVDRRTTSLGYYKTPEEAHAAYVLAKRKLHRFGTL